MVSVYYDKDADLSLLAGKTIGIIGYGSQGHAHALNLKDNGQHVMVGLQPESSSRERAREAGLEVADVAEVTRQSNIVMVLIPDHLQAAVYREQIEPNIRDDATLMFAHGFCIHLPTGSPLGCLGCLHGGPQGTGAPHAGVVYRGHRCAVVVGHPPRRFGPLQRHDAGLRQGHRLHRFRCVGDHLQERDGDRPLRRADGALREA